MTGIRASFRNYETWLRRRLGDRFVAADLRHKHKLMRADRFCFLRGTCWRWAETARDICPDLADAPDVASIVDSHIGNFGLWRDREGRLVWGVNDYDEGARTPWPFDLVRLAASSLVQMGHRRGAAPDAEAIVEGYRRGLEHPRPFVLQRDRLWLRGLVSADRRHREAFWDELLSAPPDEQPDEGFASLLAGALPEKGIGIVFARRRAGVGSLGRLRLVAAASNWRGGPVAREAKAVVPSCWDRDGEPGGGYALAFGRYRAPDPWLRLEGGAVLRRLAPDSRKLDLGEADGRARRRLLKAMGRDIAAVHAADEGCLASVRADLAARPKQWLAEAARAAAEATERDWKAWR
ncbi:MAG: hypothetical protein QOH81_2118 [Sphingomonadales bacterium]|jgi:hypothetical protein|nr:hypothetical protein [Sphingomonadales bacterium]